MKKFLVLPLWLIFSPLFGGEFAVTVRRAAPNVLEFQTVYHGSNLEAALPARANLTSFQNKDESIEPEEARARIGLRLKDGSAFTYRLITGANPDFGGVLEAWYPVSADRALSNSYSLTVEGGVAFIYPYLAREEALYRFESKDSPRLVFSRFTVLSEQGSPSVTVIQGRTLDSEPDEIRRLYQHNVEIYGDRGFDEIVVIGSPLTHEGVVYAGKKIFLLMPQRGTLPQFARLIPEVWADTVPGMSPRIFAMFKDAALRFKPLSLPPNTQGPYVTDPLWVEPSAPQSYYQTLFAEGIDSGKSAAMVDVRAEALLDNNPMLRLADRHLGLDAFFAGMKSLFQNPAPFSAPVNAPDYEKIDWAVLFQNRLSEPFLSFFQKDAFRPGFTAVLTADNKAVSRNSDHIPDFRITKENGETVPIDWGGKRSVPMPLTAGQLTLDTDRQVPKLNYIDAFYTFNPVEQASRRRVLDRAASMKIPSVEAFRRHLDLLSFPAPEGNAYGVEAGRTVYAAVSVVLASGSRGSLKPAIQEAFFVLDEHLQPLTIATRLRL